MDLDNALNDERVLWTGRPSSTRPFLIVDVLLIPASIAVSGIVVLHFVRVASTGGLRAAGLSVLPFAVMAAYLTVGRFFVVARRLASTTYTITDRRVIVRRQWPWPQTREADLDDLAEPVLGMNKDRSTGDIAFGRLPTPGELVGEAGLIRRGFRPAPLLLRSIENVKLVRDLILAAQRP